MDLSIGYTSKQFAADQPRVPAVRHGPDGRRSSLLPEHYSILGNGAVEATELKSTQPTGSGYPAQSSPRSQYFLNASIRRRIERQLVVLLIRALHGHIAPQQRRRQHRLRHISKEIRHKQILARRLHARTQRP